jgi:hypothetical protein
MRYFTDFYTENPAVYYPTKKGSFRAGDDRINVVVEPGAAPNGTPQVTAHHDDGDEYTVSIPPYADALSAADDKAGWWNRHRPLIMETAALGPRSGGSNDRSDPGKRKPNHNFQGFRVLSVSGPTVSAIRYVEMDELRAKGFRMPWETTGGAGAARDPTAPAGRVD